MVDPQNHLEKWLSSQAGHCSQCVTGIKSRKKGSTSVLSTVRWWMKKGWGQVTGWGQCCKFPSLLWHCWLGDRRTSALCENLCRLTPKGLFKISWGRKQRSNWLTKIITRKNGRGMEVGLVVNFWKKNDLLLLVIYVVLRQNGIVCVVCL